MKKLFNKLKNIISGGNILYYPGCLTHFVYPDIEENYKNLLKMMEIDFIFIPEFNCCGSPVLNAGYKEDFEDLQESNRIFLQKYGIKKIITSCPACYLILKNNYGLDVEHITETIMKNIHKINPKFAKDVEGNKITYHDPCHLGRKGRIFNEPRKIIKNLNLKLIELPCNHNDSLCCGAGGGLKNHNPKLAEDIAKARLKLCKTVSLVTPCPMCYSHFKEHAKDKGIEVLEFSQLLIGKSTSHSQVQNDGGKETE